MGTIHRDAIQYSECVFSEDIFYIILLKVPLEPLLRFKSVCKAWSRLISDRNFANSQLAYHLRNSQPNIVFQTTENIEGKCKSEYFSINIEEKDVRAKKIQFHLEDKYIVNEETLLIRASCNGILFLQCIQDRELYYICNPITRNSTKLPAPSNSHCEWTLVYDASIKKYKVVGICNTGYKCFVFTLGNEQDEKTSWAWRTLVTPIPRFVFVEASVFINEELHWLLRTYPYVPRRGLGWGIYSMDVGKEEFRMTLGPPCFHKVPNGLVELKGSVCIVSYSFPDQLDFWVLEDMDKCIWTKNHSINFGSMFNKSVSTSSVGIYYASSKDTTCSASTKIICQQMNEFLSYDLKSLELRHFIFNNAKRWPCRFLHTFSLVGWE